jgi:parallel beta-helix repeat protein
LYGASNSIIANNSISNQYIAIWMAGAVGIIVSGNNITNCQTKGIFVGDYSNIIQNRVTNTGSTNLPGGGYSGGVAILLSSNCAIAGNLIEDNAIGIAATTSGGLFGMVPGGPQGSIIYDNNFINNTNNVVNSAVMGASLGTIAIWNNGKIGNYWSDYFAKYPNAVEILNSGIGNTPYTIDSNNTDYYPLLAPYDISSNALKPINLLPSPTPTASPSQSPIITVSPSPTVSEFSWLAILPLALFILSIAVIVRHRK